MVDLKIYFARTLKKLDSLFGRSLVVSGGLLLLVAVMASVATFLHVSAVVPTTLTIASGPKGSVFEKNALRYRDILARDGVKLKIVPSEGSIGNLKKLTDPKVAVDVGFVLGGEARGAGIDNLMSLGSISFQPLMIFYRGKPKSLLADFAGERIDIGQPGSGTHSLALSLLAINGVDAATNTRLVNVRPVDPVKALLGKQVDAIFLMSDSTSVDTIRELMHAEGIHLFSFTQADGYTRRFNYLNKLVLPKGSVDFGKDIPAEDIDLIGPTVELVARKSLHPALSDLLLEAAREVHGSASLFRRQGQFPAPIEHEFRISPDASRYYASGKTYLYRTFPFWLASWATRVLALVVPLALLLIPAFKALPALYRWRTESRLYRWYRVLLDLERDALKPSVDARRRSELLRHLDQIERSVNEIKVPAFCGGLFYDLRGHIGFVRDSLLSTRPDPDR